MQALNGGMTPQAMAQQVMQNNPQAVQMIQQMQRDSGGRSARDVAMEYCRSCGIPEQDVISLAAQMGIK